MQLCLHKVVERVCAAVVLRLERCALEVRVSMETCQALEECEESHIRLAVDFRYLLF